MRAATHVQLANATACTVLAVWLGVRMGGAHVPALDTLLIASMGMWVAMRTAASRYTRTQDVQSWCMYCDAVGPAPAMQLSASGLYHCGCLTRKDC